VILGKGGEIMVGNSFDLGIVYPMIYPGQSERETVENIDILLKDDYFKVIEIGRYSQRIKSEIKEKIRSSKIDVIYSGHGILLGNNLNINTLDEEVRKKSVEVIKAEIDEASDYKARLFTLLSGTYRDGDKVQHMAALKNSLHEICTYAYEEYEMKVALEAFDYNIDKKSFIGPTIRAKELMDEMDERNLGLLVDLSHIPMLGEDIDEAIEPIKDYIYHLHIGSTVLDESSQLYGDSHPRFGHSEGINDTKEVQRFLEKVATTDYMKGMSRPTLSFEVKPTEGECSEVVIANSKRTLRRAWLGTHK